LAKFALDTNVYADATSAPGAAAPLGQFLRTYLARTYLSAVVIQELCVGARTPAQVTALRDGIVAPFERRRRVVTPSSAAFWECGRVLADMVAREGVVYAETNRSLVNDVLLAVSCREHGITLVTRDTDFGRIARYVKGFTHIAPFPS
jgi:predicted nucleic acid-binding protein